MPKTRPPYPPEFRRQMVELVRAGRTPRELAREFEPSYETIRSWVCQAKGLTEEEGVLIPVQNVDNLMLSEEVVEAVDKGEFHIYPVSTVEEGIEILAGVPAGTLKADGTFPEGTVFARIATRLEQIRKVLKEEAEKEEEKEKSA